MNKSIMGVQVVYEPGNFGTLYLVSNNSANHNFQVTTIKNANRVNAYIDNEYLVVQQSISADVIALGVEFDPTGNDLVVMGLFQQLAYTSTFDNSPMFICQFDKTTGNTTAMPIMHEVASQNYYNFGQNVLNPFTNYNALATGYYNKVYTPSAMVSNAVNGYTFLGHRLLPNSTFNTEIISTSSVLSVGNHCSIELIFNPSSAGTAVYYNLLSNDIFPDVKNIIFGGEAENIFDIQYLCPAGGEQRTANPTFGNEDNNYNEQFLVLYPNPTNSGRFNLEMEGFATNKTIQILNVYGKLITEFVVTENQTSIDLSNYAKGMYLVKISDGNHEKVQKVIFE